jgi:asparagine synthase (glutamine-hydrolysing)
MANSVEGRLPFLDYRLVEFCSRLPDDLKLRGLMEKWLLKQMGRKLLPAAIWQRVKRPYRAPIKDCFFNARQPEYVADLLSEQNLRESNLFQPGAAGQLARKAAAQPDLSEMDSMAVVGILSALLVERQFCHGKLQITAAREGGSRKFIDQRSETAVRPAWM